MPHNFLGTELKVDNFRKGTFLDAFDEPTYLTFALDFKFDSDSGPNDSSISESRLWDSPLFDLKREQSAFKFLSNRGYTAQAQALKTFRSILQYLTFDAPWYFQSISGISGMYKQSSDMTKHNRGSGMSIEVTTLEAIDLRMQEVASLYRNAIFDLKYRRERIPDNLRWFSVDVYLAEFRNMRYRLPNIAASGAGVLGINTSTINNAVTTASQLTNNVSSFIGATTGNRGSGIDVSSVMKQFGFIKFSCRQCEFDFSDSISVGSTINIGGTSMQAATNKFKIKVGYFEEVSEFGDGSVIYDDPIKTAVKNPWGTKAIGSIFQGTANSLIRTGENLANGISSFSDGENAAKRASFDDTKAKAIDSISGITGGINKALLSAVSIIDPPVKNGALGEANQFGYATNNDQVPPRPAEPNDNVYD